MTRFTYHVTPVQVVCRDKTRLCATLFSPKDRAAGGTMIVCSALGVGQTFYHPYAAFLCEQQYRVITFDYRGSGGNRDALPLESLQLADWGREDIRAMIDYAESLPGNTPVFLTGHSVGGQLFCLAENAGKLRGVILVAASFPHWKRWPFPRNLAMYFFFHVLVPVLGIGRKHFPTKRLGLSKENLPKRFISDWAGWARHKDYVTAEKFRLDLSQFTALSAPILSFGFDDDTYVPKKAICRLLDTFELADIQEIFVEVKQKRADPVGHFGFFKKNSALTLWHTAAKWLENLTGHRTGSLWPGEKRNRTRS